MRLPKKLPKPLIEEQTMQCKVNDKLYHIMLYWVHLSWARLELTTLVVIGTNGIGSCNSKYYKIRTTRVSYC